MCDKASHRDTLRLGARPASCTGLDAPHLKGPEGAASLRSHPVGKAGRGDRRAGFCSRERG